MKKLFTLCILHIVAIALFAQTPTSIHQFRCVTLAGDTVDMSQYYGKKLMVVNVASYCQFTPQYRPLQAVYDQYHQYNFEILGFPSDDFGGQGGTDSAIGATCTGYNVTFLIMEKVACISHDTAPVYKWLQRQDLNGVENSHVSWNFNKYLIDEAGHYVRHYESQTAPDDTAITNWIMSASVVHDTIAVPDSTMHTGMANISGDNLIQIQSSNPTNTTIDLAISLPTAQHLDIAMYAVDGKLVGNIYNGTATQSQQISYPVGTLPSGIYLIKAQTNSGQQVMRCMVQH